MTSGVEPWPTDALERPAGCPLCGRGESTLMHQGLTDVTAGCAPGTWTLRRCASCGIGFLDPRPTRSSIGLAYVRYYTHAVEDESEPSTYWLRLRRALGNGYRNHLLGSRLRPSLGVLGVLATAAMPRLREGLRNEAVGLAAPPHRAAPPARWLDVGCGSGLLLARARRLGWAVAGIEPDAQAASAARSRGIDILGADIDALACEERFDRVSLNHVIEHVHDPMHLLSRCRALLRDGNSSLWIETPNIDSVGHKRYGAHWRGLEAPRHLVLFHPEALRDAVHRAGFSRVKILPPRGAELDTFEASARIEAGQSPMSPHTSALDPPRQATLCRDLARARKTVRRWPSRADFTAIEARP